MKYIFSLFTLTLCSFVHAQDANFVWAKRTPGQKGRCVVTDAAGNVYTTGAFGATADFDPGPGVYNLTAINQDIFVNKFDSSGNFIWARQFGGPASFGEGYGVAVDAQGNVYTTGYFDGTTDFDPGAGTYNLTSAGDGDIFVSKLDAAGNFVWAKSMGGIYEDHANSIAIDPLGNVYTTGFFTYIADFDPGSGIYNLLSGGQPTGNSDQNIFVSKLDASGNLVWAKNMGGMYDDQGSCIKLDGLGNVYTVGNFQGTADFDPGAGSYNLTSAGGMDIFISKLDASGNFVYAKNMGGIDYDYGNSITVDASGNVYTTGIFHTQGDFDPGPGVYNLTTMGASDNDAFISKLDAFGNFVWAKNIGSIFEDRGYSITVDGSGNVYTTGTFVYTVDFDPGPGVYNLTYAGGYDIFISKLDVSGNFVWAKKIGGGSDDFGYAITLDANRNVYVTGSFQDMVDFDPGPGTYNLTAAGPYRTFILKLGQPIVSSSSDYFRTKASGNWNDINTWESSSDNINWHAATLTPDFTANTITIRNPHTITVTANVIVDQLIVVTGASISVNSSVIFTVR